MRVALRRVLVRLHHLVRFVEYRQVAIRPLSGGSHEASKLSFPTTQARTFTKEK
jgi:hypothetical protein